MILPLCVIDITDKLDKDPVYVCTVEDIRDWEKKHGRIPEGAFVALRTDMYKDWQSNPSRFKRYPFPCWSFEAIKFLYDERNITANGHEALDTSTDPKIEAWLLGQGHWQIEALANLDKVPEAGALIVVAWPKPESSTGFPCRAFAILP
jgi:kynurenine formamidase